jgi:membrane-bound lytic murein transglycosylase D
LPDELKYLSIVESGLRPQAISHSNAVGLWQFISSTGRVYGLNSDWYVDERMDLYEATDAACRYLGDLYSMFDDWELALAAYNAGPGNVRRAIRRSGYKRKFWDVYWYLPRETRSYVPQFVAIIYMVNFAEEHNLYPTEKFHFPEHDTVLVNQYFHLETFANQLDLCVDDLLKLNPAIKRGALPEGTANFALRVPSDLKSIIEKDRTKLYDLAASVGKKELEYLARNSPGSTYGREKVYYRVRSGDVLGTIARRYHVRVSDIRKWNNLRSNLIRVGQRLNIWVLPTYNSSTKDLYAANVPAVKKTSRLPENGKVYQVKPGDTLWSISRQISVSIETIKSINNHRFFPYTKLTLSA